MGSPRATFAIPCWQGARYLRPLLESLLAQTRQDFELILVDDASTDGSVDVARQAAGSRIEIHSNPRRLGLSANWNRCASLVRTPYFCLAHMDDVYDSRYLERMLAALEGEEGAGMVHCRARAIDAHGGDVESPVERFKEKFWSEIEGADRAALYTRLYRGNFVNCPSLLYDTAAWREAGPFPEDMKFAPDWWLGFRMLLTGHRIAAVPDTLLWYRRHDSNATRTQASTLARYEEELTVLRWAREEGQRAGLLPDGVTFSPALRNNLLLDAYYDLELGHAEAARRKLRFARENAPEVARDPAVRLFSVLARAGWPGRAVMGLGLRAVLAQGPLARMLGGVG